MIAACVREKGRELVLDKYSNPQLGRAEVT